MTFTGIVIGEQAAIRAVLVIPGKVERGGVRAMQRTVQGGAGIVKGRASGRPGPRVITGDYRRSISGQVVAIAGSRITGQIGTNAAQARRLEFGFFGPDSLGRQFAQSPRPHFAPAVPEIGALAEREFTEQISREVAA